MHTTTVGVDLAKRVFQLAIADEHFRVVDRKRLTRARFERYIGTCTASVFVMEACGSAQHWARKLSTLGHEVKLLPAQYVRAYVRRNKTDAADAAALVEASRCADIRPVAIKTLEQQQLMQLHRLREAYKRTRVAKINLLRGTLREFGLTLPQGAIRGIKAISQCLEIGDNGLPDRLRPWIALALDEIRSCRANEQALESEIKAIVEPDELVQRWLAVNGVGLLSASAVRAAGGDLWRFPSGRHFASWLGLTAREHSSGELRRLGRISKRGDAYLRTLLIHGARSALQAAHRAQQAGRNLDRLQLWALATEQRIGRNKATVALANKIARILWAMARYQRRFDPHYSVHS